MKKLFASILCVLMLFLFAFENTSANTIADVEINSDYAIVYHRNDNRVLYAKQADEKMYPASMTKIMTTLVAIEAMKEDSTFTIQMEALQGLREANASVAGFHVGEQVTYKDLLYGILLPSGADATRSIAISMFGSEAALVEKMNEKAKALHMNNTHYANTSGLHDENHYSSAKDIAKLLDYALDNALFKEIFCTKQYTTTNQRLHFTSTLQSQAARNQLDVSVMEGAKTGFTLEASLCLASYATNGGDEFIVVSGHPTQPVTLNNAPPYHIEDALTLYQYVFAHYRQEVVVKKGKEIAALKVKYASQDTLSIKANKQISLLLSDVEKQQLKVVFKPYEEEVVAPMEAKSAIGELSIYSGDTKVYQEKVLLPNDIESNKIAYYLRHIDVFCYDFRYLILVLMSVGIGYIGYSRYRKKTKVK